MKDSVSARRQSGRRWLTAYIAAVAAVCAVFTYGVSSHLVKTRKQLATWSPGAICEAVLPGDQLLLVDEHGRTNRVQLLGIQSPPTERGPALEQMARDLGMREEFVLQQGRVAQSALLIWVNQRHVQVSVPEAFRLPDPAELQLGYASRQGVDLGRKMLQQGQARALHLPHPRLDEYLAFEQEARAAKLGLWRDAF